MANVKFDQILYPIIRHKINSIDDVKKFEDIVNVLNTDPANELEGMNQAKLLYQFFRTLRVNTNKISLKENPNLDSAIQTAISGLKISAANVFNFPVDNNTVNNDTLKALEYLINYIKTLNTFNINIDNLYLVEPLSNNDYIKIKSGAININENLIGLLKFIFNSGFNTLFNTLNNTDDYQELSIPKNLFIPLEKPDIINNISSETYIDSLRTLYTSSNDKEFYDNFINTIPFDTSTDISTLKEVTDTNSSEIQELFMKQKLTIKKTDKNPVPKDIDTVNTFFSALTDDSTELKKVRVHITEDNEKTWDSQLFNIYKNVINYCKVYKKFFKDIYEINTDEELSKFIQKIDTHITTNDKNLQVAIDSLKNTTVHIDKQVPNKIVEKLNKSQIYKLQFSKFLETIINGKTTVVLNPKLKGRNNDEEETTTNTTVTVLTQETFEKYALAVLNVISSVINGVSVAKKQLNDINTLLISPIYLDANKKESITLQSLLASLVAKENDKALNGKDVSKATGKTKLFDGIISDMIKIANRLKVDNICYFNENCNAVNFKKSLINLVSNNFSEEELTEFGKTLEIWSKPCDGYTAINTLYNTFNNVTADDKFLVVLYTVMIPLNFIKT